MSRKDYVKVAAIIAAARAQREEFAVSPEPLTAIDTIEYFQRTLADMFAEDSPKFDRKIFAKACEVQNG